VPASRGPSRCARQRRVVRYRQDPGAVAQLAQRTGDRFAGSKIRLGRWRAQAPLPGCGVVSRSGPSGRWPTEPVGSSDLADQLIRQLTRPAVTGIRRLDIPAVGFVVQPRLPGHLPEPGTGQPRPEHLTYLCHAHLPERHPPEPPRPTTWRHPDNAPTPPGGGCQSWRGRDGDAKSPLRRDAHGGFGERRAGSKFRYRASVPTQRNFFCCYFRPALRRPSKVMANALSAGSCAVRRRWSEWR